MANIDFIWLCEDDISSIIGKSSEDFTDLIVPQKSSRLLKSIPINDSLYLSNVKQV